MLVLSGRASILKLFKIKKIKTKQNHKMEAGKQT